MTAPAEGAGERTAPYPRVLFITSHAFNKTTGGGVTFTNLFKGWPKDRLATVHNDTVPVTTDVCDHYYRLTAAEIRRWPPTTISSGNVSPAPPVEAGASHPSARQVIQQVIQDGARAAGRWVFGDSLPQSGHLTAGLERWTADFDPDVIYTILGSIGLMELVEKVQERFALPLVIHMMDDWPAASFRRGLLAPWQRRRMHAVFARLIDKASVRMGIGEAMCRAFQESYDLPFVPFQNAVDASTVPRKDPARLNDPVRIAYAGSILANAQAKSLAECCQAIAELNRDGRPVRLDIYSPPFLAEPHRRDLEVHPAIRLLGPLTDDHEFFATIAAADILLMPVNFDVRSVRFIRYSMPTRIPAYLAVGTPILVYGPSGIAQVDYAREAGWGLVVDRPGIPGLKAALLRLADDADLRRRVSAAATRTARKNHDVSEVRQRFRAALIQAARAPSAG